MKNNRLPFILLVLAMLACQFGAPETPAPAAPTTQPAPTNTLAAGQADPGLTPTPQASRPTATAMAVVPGDQLMPFTTDLTRPFGGGASLAAWSPGTYAGEDASLPVDLLSVSNEPVLANLTPAQRDFLAHNGFVVIRSQEKQFADIRTSVSDLYGQPYFLTTDAAYHALHLLFDEMLKAIERQWLRPSMMDLARAALDQVLSDLSGVEGTSIEAETLQAAAYLSVALKLFDPEATIDPQVADSVTAQVDQILAAAGRERSALFPDFEDDYGAYKPVSHYAGDPELEAYFRGMTWFGRMHFQLKDAQNPDFKPSRLPLIVTLALRRAQFNGQPASDAWAQAHEALNFIIGPSDDPGPPEYAALMDQVYGDTLTIQGLADDSTWQEFIQRSDELPAPQINSTFASFSSDLVVEKGWRFMGQRFTLDAFIFQNLIFDKVEARPDGQKRLFPSGLDMAAAFGSDPALDILEQAGMTDYPNYADQMALLRQTVQAQQEARWLGRFYDGWLYSFLPVLATKDGTFPAFMRSQAWAYKDINTMLGSWAELKHDTVLYSKMPEAMGGGGPPGSGPAPAYVEPNPQAFYRMAYVAKSLAEGLSLRIPDPYAGESAGPALGDYINGMQTLSGKFSTFADMAARELAGQPLTDDDRYAIQSCLGMVECLNEKSAYRNPASEMPPLPVLAAVSGAENQVLEVGVGYIDRIYVLVPLEGKLQAAQGGVFSYYEFLQPRSDRLTDAQWRERLASGQPPAPPAWADNFVLDGGGPADWLAFRVGDVYLITEAGDRLNVRAAPTRSSQVLGQFLTNDYVEILDGPVAAGGYTWWKLACAACFGSENEDLTGWAVEQHDWYERAHGQ
jgi:hypothetical protein